MSGQETRPSPVAAIGQNGPTTKAIRAIAVTDQVTGAPTDGRTNSPGLLFTNMSSTIEINAFGNRVRLKELRVAHRDLDLTINKLTRNPQFDQLRIKRLKKRKLLLKDMIVHLESELIPNLNA
jgi:hypothetical protein